MPSSLKVEVSVTPEELQPLPVYPLKDVEASSRPEPIYHDYQTGIPIAIDLGRSTMKIGLANKKSPSNVFPSIISKYRERKLNKTLTILGNDIYLDSSIKSSMRSPFDGPMITNWDTIETLLDYSFAHLGVNSSGKVDNPIVMSEVLAAPLQQRSTMMQLVFEAYSTPKAAFGVDSLFSFYENKGSSGLVISSGHDATHLIPVVSGKPLLNISKRIDWGGSQSVNYLAKYMPLKYPFFPSKINNYQIGNLIKDHCYVSSNYNQELSQYLEMDVLENKDRVIEAPFLEVIKVQKTEEELRIETEKRKESGRRLQEQAQKARLEKLVQKEQEFAYYSELKVKLQNGTKKLILSTLQTEGFDNEAALDKYIANLDKFLKRVRNQDLGIEETEEIPTFPLLEVPDEQLDEEQQKEKKKQRLMKANYDARMRAKLEKEEQKKKVEEDALKDKQWRETDIQGWIADRKAKLDKLIQRKKERRRLKEELSDRKSRAAQIRMKNLASLASDDGPGDASNRRKRAAVTIDNDPNDTFGANDDDWAVYRDIALVDDDEAEEEEEQALLTLEQELLEFDSEFSIEDTFYRQFDWRKSILHRFLRGPREFNPEDAHQQHQIHLNVERIKVPEVLFQPSIAGIDQAGISEISEDILLRRLPQEKGFSGDIQQDILKDIFLTGGQALFENFEDRIYNDFRSFLPVDANLRVRKANDPILDAWRGMASWSTSSDSADYFISKQEYEEMGPEYIKENRMGCVRL
ncbi:unnamed protein product [Kuraishia capsulata CBS 1993]|uniref:Actin-related protein 5 n=1 Tax=Kuraishia capsulata CBS 1993 TaxID=1382522 RepID=W6MSA1_9ASCO|nr:uncharacterized protein KUCA_T00005664001 [Kuraishia capsulata CBS 1993]CDK29671.1 unnamed protein product [Kuraishia capsulata CBS 1993]